MYYGNIKKMDIANGEGIRTSLFVSGCRNRCEGCFQPETWNFSFGREFTRETEEEILQSLVPAYVDGLSLLGGEPFEPENQRALLPFLRRVKEDFPGKDIWCYSGYTMEEILGEGHPHCEVSEEMLGLIDVLVDGKFVLALKNLSLRFRGSANQRVIDLKKTRVENKVVLYCE